MKSQWAVPTWLFLWREWFDSEKWIPIQSSWRVNLRAWKSWISSTRTGRLPLAWPIFRIWHDVRYCSSISLERIRSFYKACISLLPERPTQGSHLLVGIIQMKSLAQEMWEMNFQPPLSLLSTTISRFDKHAEPDGECSGKEKHNPTSRHIMANISKFSVTLRQDSHLWRETACRHA